MASEPPPGSKFFIGHLTQAITEDDLRTHFQRFGTVLHVKIPKDPVRSGNCGFAFITYDQPNASVMQHKHVINGTEVKVEIQRSKPGGGLGGGSYTHGGGGDGFRRRKKSRSRSISKGSTRSRTPPRNRSNNWGNRNTTRGNPPPPLHGTSSHVVEHSSNTTAHQPSSIQHHVELPPPPPPHHQLPFQQPPPSLLNQQLQPSARPLSNHNPTPSNPMKASSYPQSVQNVQQQAGPLPPQFTTIHQHAPQSSLSVQSNSDAFVCFPYSLCPAEFVRDPRAIVGRFDPMIGGVRFPPTNSSPQSTFMNIPPPPPLQQPPPMGSYQQPVPSQYYPIR